MTKRLLILFLVVALIFTFSACGSSKPGEGKNIVMVTDAGGLGDGSFNDSANEGLKKAEDELGIKANVLESETADDYARNFITGVEEGGDLLFGVGYLLAPAITEIAGKNPEQYFAIIDETIDLENVISVTFKENEGSFLVGVIAGLTTESDVVGFIGGIESPDIQKFEYGFKAGVKSVNPDAEVVVNYTESFSDPDLGKDEALQQNQLGADVIYHSSGACGLGIIQAAQEHDFWVIGVNEDQSNEDPEHVLCSMIKNVDSAAYTLAKAVVEDTFENPQIMLGLREDGVGYSDEAGNLSEDIAAVVDKFKEAIIDDAFEVPFDKATYDAFEGYSVD
ncbi:MAG: BMP family lipoprotein [Eubacteriales bacterium]